MAKKSIYEGYSSPQDYFENAPVELLQKHYASIEDFEVSMLYNKALKQYRNPTPLLKPHYKILESMGLEIGGK